MTSKKTITSVSAVIILITSLLLTSCNGEIATVEDPTATPTPTKVIQVVPPTQTETPSKCAGLAGELEVQVLVGPAEVVGLEPHTVGSIPFTVTTNEKPFLLQGGGDLTYSDILAEEWGTYEVSMNLQFTITGECDDKTPTGELAMKVEMAGSQMVEVTADGFHGEYPWDGTHTIDLHFPLEEGAAMEGEGWSFVLHLK